VRRLARPAVVFLIVFASTELFPACSGSREAADTTELDGMITVRGNVPFNAPILETSGRNLYVLVLREDQLGSLSTPGRYRIYGRIYLDKWNGKPYAHVDVRRLIPLD
jgi:hypothetical protein